MISSTLAMDMRRFWANCAVLNTAMHLTNKIAIDSPGVPFIERCPTPIRLNLELEHTLCPLPILLTYSCQQNIVYGPRGGVVAYNCTSVAPGVVPILLPHPISFPTLPISFPDVNRTRALLIESARHCEIMTCLIRNLCFNMTLHFRSKVQQGGSAPALLIESATRWQCTCTFDRKCSLHFIVLGRKQYCLIWLHKYFRSNLPGRT